MTRHDVAGAPTKQRATRRDFLRRSSAAGGALVIDTMARQAHAAGREALKVALVGCGGRGTGAVTQALRVARPIKLWAMADLFPDQVERSLAILTKGVRPRDDYEAQGTFGPEQIDVPLERRFTGLNAYQQAIDSGADLIFLTTPPGFRPLHYAAAVRAGKHVFLEKPCCVDAPGFRSLMETNKLAAEKGLKVGVGLQRRHSPAYLEFVHRIRDGAVGAVRFLQAYFNGSGSWVRPRRPNESEMEFQIRNFQYFVWVAGDFIVEAHVHNLDACNWFANNHPVEANGMGARRNPEDGNFGQTFDQHMVEFTYANGVKLFSQCRYIPGCWSHCGEDVYGTEGRGHVAGWVGGEQGVSLSGKVSWRYKGPKVNPWEQELADLIAAIRENRPYHEGWYGATSSFTGVLGRMATYSGQIVRWDEAVAKGPSEMPPMLALDAEPPVRPDAHGRYPVPCPGTTKPY